MRAAAADIELAAGEWSRYRAVAFSLAWLRRPGPSPAVRLIDWLRHCIRTLHFSYRTE